MIRIVAIFVVISLFPISISAQNGYLFGVKGGLSFGIQQWNGFNRSVLLRPHGDIYIESWTPENKFSLMAMLGYHVRGSSLRTNSWYDPETMMEFGSQTTDMAFQNIVLTLGAKQKFPFGLDHRAYYMLGMRGEYTAGTNFEGYLEYLEGSENSFVFGMSFSTGMEFTLSRFVGALFEISVHPDFTKQIYVPPQDTGFNDPISGNPITLQEQNITNVSFEISIGLRFLREIIYVD